MDNLRPVERCCVFLRNSETFAIGPVYEQRFSLRIGHPDHDRRTVRHLTKTLFALAQGLFALAPHARHFQKRFDAGDQLASAERLYDIIIRSRVHAFDVGFFSRARG